MLAPLTSKNTRIEQPCTWTSPCIEYDSVSVGGSHLLSSIAITNQTTPISHFEGSNGKIVRLVHQLVAFSCSRGIQRSCCAPLGTSLCVWMMTRGGVNGSQSPSNGADLPFRWRFAKRRPDNIKRRLICHISCASVPPRMHRPSLWAHTKGREQLGARVDAEMSENLPVKNECPN